MRRFYIVANKEKKNVEYDTALIRSYLEEKGCVCAVKETVKKPGPAKYRYTNPEDVPRDTECVIVLGGDGTLLQAARDLSGMDIPMIGVNLGTLGYLAQIGREEDILPALDALMEENYELESRMMLKGVVRHTDGRVEEDISLNDIVITRSVGFHGLQPVRRRAHRGAGVQHVYPDAHLSPHLKFQEHCAAAGSPGDDRIFRGLREHDPGGGLRRGHGPGGGRGRYHHRGALGA